MKELIDVFQMLWSTFSSLGWLPAPIAVAIVAMLALRMVLEPSPLAIMTKEAMARAGWMKGAIFCGVAFITLLLQFGLQKPANGFERALCLGFVLGDTMFAYVVTSSSKVKGLIKNQFTEPEAPK